MFLDRPDGNKHGVGCRSIARWISSLPAGCLNGCVDGPRACLLGWGDWVGVWVSIRPVGRVSWIVAGRGEVGRMAEVEMEERLL